MSTAFSLTIPLIIAVTALYAMLKKVDVYAAVTAGAADGLKTLFKIAPSLIGILTAVYMLRASGAIDIIMTLVSPILEPLGVPEECFPLFLLRPLSGSGAMGVGADIINTHGPDSLAGRTAAIMLGSTETTFYVIAVYFGAVNITKTRHAIPAALIADLAGFAAAVITARLFF